MFSAIISSAAHIAWGVLPSPISSARIALLPVSVSRAPASSAQPAESSRPILATRLREGAVPVGPSDVPDLPLLNDNGQKITSMDSMKHFQELVRRFESDR